MAIVYSTRFIAANAGAATQYTVPDGKLAVVRCVTMSNTDGSNVRSAGVYHNPSGMWVVRAVLPPLTFTGLLLSTVFDVRFPVEAGELIGLNGNAEVHVTVSGYLFDA